MCRARCRQRPGAAAPGIARRLATMAAVAAATASLACGEGTAPPPPSCTGEEEVTVAVGPGLTPRFTWTPSCGMASLIVAPTGAAGGGWAVYSGPRAAENPLRPGIRYGVAPPGTVVPGSAVPLIPGVAYTVVVSRFVGEPGGPNALLPRGAATFTP